MSMADDFKICGQCYRSRPWRDVFGAGVDSYCHDDRDCEARALVGAHVRGLAAVLREWPLR